MKTIRTLLPLLLLLHASALYAGWKEPWMDSVIRKSDHFVLARIISTDPQQGTVVEVVRSLGGDSLQGAITIQGFYALDLCAGTKATELPAPDFEGAEESYFFLKAEGETFRLATPTAGYAPVLGGKVSATYSHGCQLVWVPASLYEQTMTEIFRHFHGLPVDQVAIRRTLVDALNQKPIGAGRAEADSLLFVQHAALETVHYLRLQGFEEKVLPFLSLQADELLQFSAARALTCANSKRIKNILVTVIGEPQRALVVKLMSVWTLQTFRPRELRSLLNDLYMDASASDIGLEYDEKDPRASCSGLPTVQEALDRLAKELEPK